MIGSLIPEPFLGYENPYNQCLEFLLNILPYKSAIIINRLKNEDILL